MKKTVLVLVALVALLALPFGASAADWSSSVGASKVVPNPTCAKLPSSGKAWSVVNPAQAKGWSVTRPASWSDGSSFKGSRGLLAVGNKVAPQCGNGGNIPCGQWVYLGPTYPYPWIYVPC